jgi:DNA adenine methylase
MISMANNLHLTIGEEPCVKPVLRWAGSKRTLLPKLMERIRSTDFNEYVEPFAGSASLFFGVGPQKAYLSDINEELISFYQVLSRHQRQLYRTAKNYKINGGGYYKVRALNPIDLTPVERAARFLFLNHYCFNGLYRTNKLGQFNVPEGRNTGDLPSGAHLYQASTLLRRAKITSNDFETTGRYAKRGCFFYLDPPYDYTGKRDRGEYGTKQFSISDIPRLERMLIHINSKGAKFLLSYQDVPEIHPITKKWQTSYAPVRRQIASFSRYRKLVAEVLVDNI